MLTLALIAGEVLTLDEDTEVGAEDTEVGGEDTEVS